MSEKLLALSVEQIKQIRDRGYTWILDGSGNRIRKININDLWVKKEDADKLLNK